MTSILKVDNIQNASGTPYNFIKQVKSDSYNGNMALTLDTRVDIPNLSLSITPSSTSSKILIMVNLSYGGTVANVYGSGFLMRDSTDIAIGTGATGSRLNVTLGMDLANIDAEKYKLRLASMTFLDAPATTSSITYKVQVRHSSGGTMYMNRSGFDANADYGTRGISTLTIMEVAG
tara:strand:- start:529 stop:1056 length:528 start_codon:yes stop_codon:yes gene_type:complete